MLDATETEILQQETQELISEGYDVYVHPRRPLVPSFLAGFVPDAIALRQDKNLVIEVSRKSPQAAKKLESLAALLQGRDKWELRVFWVSPDREQKTLGVQDREAIRARIAEVGAVAAAGHPEAAMLVAWGAFEALARAVLTREFERPQTPGRIVQVLAREGYVTPSEADRLRALAAKRNGLIHGELQTQVSAEEMRDFAAILETILHQLPPREPSRAA
jgi:hypothetical protein